MGLQENLLRGIYAYGRPIMFQYYFLSRFFIMMYDCLKSLASMINQWFMHGILFPLAFCFHKLEMRFASQGDRYLHMSNKWELEILYIDMFS